MKKLASMLLISAISMSSGPAMAEGQGNKPPSNPQGNCGSGQNGKGGNCAPQGQPQQAQQG